MNRRGQFSIIAALLVAVVLIAAVVVTYSTIRNSPTQELSQVLSAIDETNFALKQILGFTLGYYGSVLQVTGNTTYANEAAKKYAESGLDYIAKMRPEWAPSFNLTSLCLLTNWFSSTSYSVGNLSVTYDLTGLGIYGITYNVSCSLSVQVMNTTSDKQACLKILKDGNEPLINLGKQNFFFYKYRYNNLTWETVNPQDERSIKSTADGTYYINMSDPALSQLNPYSYVVQVQDQRGIVVAASSFNTYVLEMIWSSKSIPRYAVAGSTPEILGEPDYKYKNLRKGQTCEVTAYQSGVGIIKQVYFNIVYYSPVAGGELKWYYQLDGGSWNEIGDLPEGGNATSPLQQTFNATDRRTTWTLEDLNTTYIRFKNNFNNDNNEGAFVDAIYVTIVFDIGGNYSTLPNATFVVELLQNGTVRWLGQNFQIATSAKPIPPIPVKAIRVNQTINGINCEVPFQIEDWASDYMVPLGLTNNASIFGNRHMIVFLVNPNVSKVTIWWNGSDAAVQTPWAYVNRYFKDTPSTTVGTLSNGILNLTIDSSSSGFTVKSKINKSGALEAAANFMRINNEWSIYGSDPAYAIYNGVVRDIVHAEAEWKDNPPGDYGGAPNCSNVYAHIVLTLPANATYYTYQLRLIFLNSTDKPRNITDLCPIKIKASDTLFALTENGTINGYPILNGSGLFYNFSATCWQHHWSQLNSTSKGFGIMFTDDNNKQLYIFDKVTGSQTGALKVENSTTERAIELLPVSSALTPVINFVNALDVCWYGAIVTFDGTTPIYGANGSGLWIMVEHPPVIAVYIES
ncbi:MAG: hypothetical protein QW667_02260 [Candidatus Bathyarchaeia archaeon]